MQRFLCRFVGGYRWYKFITRPRPYCSSKICRAWLELLAWTITLATPPSGSRTVASYVFKDIFIS